MGNQAEKSPRLTQASAIDLDFEDALRCFEDLFAVAERSRRREQLGPRLEPGLLGDDARGIFHELLRLSSEQYQHEHICSLCGKDWECDSEDCDFQPHRDCHTCDSLCDLEV